MRRKKRRGYQRTTCRLLPVCKTKLELRERGEHNTRATENSHNHTCKRERAPRLPLISRILFYLSRDEAPIDLDVSVHAGLALTISMCSDFSARVDVRNTEAILIH